MNADEFRAEYEKGKPFQVYVRGWVAGYDMRWAFHTSAIGSGVKSAHQGETSIVAEVRIESAEIRNTDTTIAGTSMQVERYGGGTIRVPIDDLSLTSLPS